MRITPLDVRKQEFRKVVRGLDPEEVYAFLATAADEYEVVLTDNKQLREKVLELDDKVNEYRNMERTLRDTLLTAERVMAEARENARKEAELILRDAHVQADVQTASISSQVQTLKTQLRELRMHRDQFLMRLRSMADSQVGLVESYLKDFEGDDRSVDQLANVGDTPAAPVQIPASVPDRPAAPSPSAGSDHWRDYSVDSREAETVDTPGLDQIDPRATAPLDTPPVAQADTRPIAPVSAPVAPNVSVVPPIVTGVDQLPDRGPVANDFPVESYLQAPTEPQALPPLGAPSEPNPSQESLNPTRGVEEVADRMADLLAEAGREAPSANDYRQPAYSSPTFADLEPVEPPMAETPPQAAPSGQPWENMAPYPPLLPDTDLSADPLADASSAAAGFDAPAPHEAAGASAGSDEPASGWSLSRFTKGLGRF